jgi:hypothetical protein
LPAYAEDNVSGVAEPTSCARAGVVITSANSPNIVITRVDAVILSFLNIFSLLRISGHIH